METQLRSRFGVLQFTFRYDVTGADVRDQPTYGRRRTYKYLPTELTFVLSSSSGDADDQLPSYVDLKTNHATLRGRKLKADGTPGLQEVREEFYYGSYPLWIADLIEAAAAELRKEDK